ncbi:MAG: ABC transporter ATP-binding protein [Spirochaetota bacterium]
MTKIIVQAEQLTKIYNSNLRALNGVSLRVCQGEWLGIMGPSGSGKTTMLNLIGCLDRPTGGRLNIDGIEVAGLDQTKLTRFRREHIGLIFQQFYLISYLSALENVMLAQYFHSMADEKEARLALEQVGLGDRLYHLPSQLSGGEQQRVCIARALINQPALILADEPTGNLDKTNEQSIMDIFRELHTRGTTIVVVTHDPRVGRLADRLVYLDHGQIALPSHEAQEAVPF